MVACSGVNLVIVGLVDPSLTLMVNLIPVEQLFDVLDSLVTLSTQTPRYTVPALLNVHDKLSGEVELVVNVPTASVPNSVSDGVIVESVEP